MENKIELIKLALNEITPVEQNAWEFFERNIEFISLRKNEFLWEKHESCKHLVFIFSGLIRMYDINFDDNKEVTLEFFFENNLLLDYYSYLTKENCIQYYQACENCELLIISTDVLEELCNKYKCFERIGRILAEANFLYLLNTVIKNKYSNPEQSYCELLVKRPHLIQRIPLKFLASYIGVTPEHLSRIRKKISITI